MVLPIRPAFRPILLGALVALVCGSVVALAMLPAKVSEHARKAETSATGSQLRIAVTAPVRAPVAASTGKLATLPDTYADAGAAVSRSPAASSRRRDGARRVDEAVVVDDEDEDVAVAPRYARAEARWAGASQADDDDAYDQPPPADPPARYRSYREEAWRDREPRRFDDRYAAAPYPAERYYPPYGR